MENLREGILLGMGNPLLDITVEGSQQLLDKYKLDPNNAIIASDDQNDLYQEIMEKYERQYSAGGATQNVLRVAQWILNKPRVAIFMGCVGIDEESKILKEKAVEAGVHVEYQYHDTVPTGKCAVIITQNNGSHRSLCAYLGAANHFTIDHIRKPDNQQYIQNAEYYYISGFFLTVSPETILEVAKTAAKSNKLFMMNLSAPFICQFFKKPQMEAMPYVDILFGNETEFGVFSEEQNFGTKDLKEIIKKVIELPKENKARSRIVIITQGHDPVLYGHGDVVDEIGVPQIPSEQVIDTNGAGDAFVGGFLSQLVLEKNIEKCIECGNWAAGHIVQRSGCTFDLNVTYPG